MAIIFTHDDLDGYACGIVAKMFIPDIVVYNTDYNSVDEVMLKALIDVPKGEKATIIIADLSYHQTSVEITNILSNHNVYVADHHMTSLWLKDTFKYTNMAADGDKCAAELLYELLSGTMFQYRYDTRRIEKFIKRVSAWDTWTWVNTIEDGNLFAHKSLHLNNALYTLGPDRFFYKVCRYLSGKTIRCFSSYDNAKIEKACEAQRYDIEVALQNSKIGTMHTQAYGDVKFLFVEMTNYYQSLGSIFAKDYMSDDIDFAMFKVEAGGSLRNRRNGIDLSVIAKELGGGGHADAAGFNFDNNYEEGKFNIPNFNFVKTEKPEQKA